MKIRGGVILPASSCVVLAGTTYKVRGDGKARSSPPGAGDQRVYNIVYINVQEQGDA
jgi:hypothetical protein